MQSNIYFIIHSFFDFIKKYLGTGDERMLASTNINTSTTSILFFSALIIKP